MRTLTGTRKLATWATAGIFGAGALTGVVLSQTGLASADSASPNTTAPAPGAHPRAHPGARHPGLALPGRAEYGTVTLWGKDAKDHQVTFRQGTATISGTSITVTSKDGTSDSYTPASDAKILLNGKAASLSQLAGKEVRVLVEDGAVKRIVSGTEKPRHKRFHVVTGTLSSVNGNTFVVNGKTYTLGPKARVAKDGQATTLSTLIGQKVHVLLGPGANATTARGVEAGKPPRHRGPGFAPGSQQQGGPEQGGPQPGDAPATAPGDSTLNG